MNVANNLITRFKIIRQYKMNSYQIYQVAMDCNAPPGITHRLFKENYAWVDEELEKREENFSSRRLTPVPLSWLYKYGERQPFYQPLEEEEEGEEHEEYEDDRQYEDKEYEAEYEYEYENEDEEDYDKLEYDKYAYHINRIDQMWNSDVGREVCSPSMPSLININDNWDYPYPFTQSLLHIIQEPWEQEPWESSIQDDVWKNNEEPIQEAPLPCILEILHDEDIAVLDADDMAVLDVEEIE